MAEAKTIKKIVRKVPKQEADVAEKIRELRYLREETAGLTARSKAIQEEIIEALKKQDKTRIEVDGKEAVIVQGYRTVIDQFGLKEDLTEEQWRSITSTVFDQKKLEAAVAAQEIPLSVVAKHSDEKPNAPYVKG